MNKSKYEQKKRECWEEAVLHGALEVDKDLLFDHAFKCGYAFGKQEKDAEGEEMLTVSRKQVQNLYNYHKSRGHHLAGESLIKLFGSKCLPDEQSSVPSPKSDVPSSEPKFKMGDKVKNIANPHDDGIYRIDDIKKSSDGFIYHIQGLIGISNVKESDLEPYTEPEKESRNLSQNIVNCDKQFDNILKDSFRNERRLNIATQMVKAIMQCPEIVERIASAEVDSLLDDILHDALYLTDRLMSECEKGDSK